MFKIFLEVGYTLNSLRPCIYVFKNLKNQKIKFIHVSPIRSNVLMIFIILFINIILDRCN